MHTFPDRHFILASGSPRRRELMAMLDVDFEVNTSIRIDERIPEGSVTCAEEVPMYLSQIKSEPYRQLLQPGDVLVTADTVVILDGEVIGKPADAADAELILAKLAGKSHKVVTGVTITTYEGTATSFTETTRVDFSPLTADEISYYVSHYSPLDKAGAYGIQEWIGAAAVKGIDGSFYNVMGLPVNRLYRELKRLLIPRTK